MRSGRPQLDYHLEKKENYLLAFDHFDAEKMARYDEAKREELMNDPGIVRNRLKVTPPSSKMQKLI